MILRRLFVDNYRGFSTARRFQFSEQFTVIAGINGRGKTALLDGLASILMRFLADLGISTSNRYGRWKATDIYAYRGSARVAIDALCAGIPVNNYAVTVSSDEDWPWRKVRAFANPLPQALRDSIVAAYGDPTDAEDQAPIAVYYTTDRAGYRLPRTLPTELPAIRQIAYRGALTSRMVDYRDFMARYRLWSSAKGSKELQAFNYTLGVFLEEFGDVEVDEEPLQLTIHKGDSRLSLQQLSDGERAFLAVLGDLVRRLALANPKLDNPLLAHGVVLIDELELHLHPRWQREVVEKLRTTFPNIQFIATTHSPFIIQSLRPGELITLDPEEFGEYANRSVEDIAENVMGIDVPQKSERYLEMMQAAEDYYRLLREPDTVAANIAAAEDRLNQLSTRFSDDPAFQALLKLELEAKKAEVDNAAG